MSVVQNENKWIKYYSWAELLVIIGLACVPLFASFPFRINIFLSWEGAYRISEGQMPFRDFGLPMGYMYWIVPAVFFKIFGAQLITLVKAQVFINIISGLAFRSILKSVGVNPAIRLLSVVVYCLSFSFINFWPWYNHTVIVYEMIGLAFLLRYLFQPATKWYWVLLVLSAFFTFVSFFTKQDGGALGFLLCSVLLLYNSIIGKKWLPLAIYIGSFVLIGFLFIYPLTSYQFGYWFNHGQPPHQARFSAFDIIDEFFYSSQWIKFYLLLIAILLAVKVKDWKSFLSNKKEMLFLLLTLGILAEAAILQITSYTPPEGNIFFHSFAFAYILSQFTSIVSFPIFRPQYMFLTLAGVLLWWSGSYWKYFTRILDRVRPDEEMVSNSENVVNRKTYILNKDTGSIPQSQWIYSNLKSFKKIYMPAPTVHGIERIMKLDVLKTKDPRVLNMTELTPLAAEVPFKLETGSYYPLWYHLGVGMFNQQAQLFEDRIRNHYYDLVLFEYIPNLNNFYPFRVRDSLQLYYHKIDSFYAPRQGDTKGMIEVYVK